MVPLSSVVTIDTRASPAAIEQFNQLNSATLSALPLPSVTTGDGLATIREIAPRGHARRLLREFRRPVAHSRSTPGQLDRSSPSALAVIVIYLVLAAQFESFRDPLIIMMAVPLSIFGALIPLNLGLGTLNIYTEVGLITLIGLITKHGILMVAVRQSAARDRHCPSARRSSRRPRVRLRPILMTTAAMVLGVVPLIIASGAGAKARFSIGLVIATGMSVGTLFTLFVVPMFYTYIARRDAAPAEEAPPAAHAPAPAE